MEKRNRDGSKVRFLYSEMDKRNQIVTVSILPKEIGIRDG